MANEVDRDYRGYGGKGLDLCVSDTKLAVFYIGCGSGWWRELKPDPTEVRDNMQGTVEFHCPIPILFFLPLFLKLNIHHMVLF